MGEYVGKICPYCKTEIKEGDEVKVCPECGIPHHAACWEENKGCTTFGCKEQHYEEQHTNPTDVCSNCGAPLGDGQAFCPKCGTPKNAPKKNVCGKCGAELQDGQEFCPKCGQKADLQIDAGVSSAISQFNAGVNKTNAAAKKKPIKIAAIAAAAILIVVLAIVLVPKIFKSADDYMAVGNYEKAYTVAKTEDKDDIVAENAVAVCSNLASDGLKDSASFELRDAWYQEGKIILLVAGNNSYGNKVTNYWYYSYDEDDKEWSLYTTFTDLSEETTYSWDSDSEQLEKILKNAILKSTVIPMTSDKSLKLSKDSIKRINALFESDLLDSVALIEP